MSECNYDSRALSIANAEKRLHDFIISRIPTGNGIITFLSLIAKEPTFDIPSMVSIPTSNGAVLYYNPLFVLELSDPELMFYSTHEFVHLVTDTFARSEIIKEDNHLTPLLFNTKIAPYFDIIVNDMLSDMPGFAIANTKGELLHSRAREEIVPPCLRFQKTIEALTTVIINNIQVIPERVAPEIEFAAARANASPTELEDIAAVLEKAMTDNKDPSLPGSISRLINSNIHRASLTQRKNSKALWQQVTQSVRITRAAALQRKRSMRRINRRTMLPPGRVFERGFRVLFLLDESGSVNDTFIRFAFEMIEHAALGDKADSIGLAHWDTNLVRFDIITKGVKPDLKRVAHGGTAFSNIYTNKEIRAFMPDMCIVVTDGECNEWPKGRIPYPTVWIINTEHGMRTWNTLCHTGSAIYISKEAMR